LGDVDDSNFVECSSCFYAVIYDRRTANSALENQSNIPGL
jgi:hypothetical protein